MPLKRQEVTLKYQKLNLRQSQEEQEEAEETSGGGIAIAGCQVSDAFPEASPEARHHSAEMYFASATEFASIQTRMTVFGALVPPIDQTPGSAARQVK
jgi:hypothetical protein